MPRLSPQQQLVCSLAVARVVLASLRPGEAIEDAIKRIRRAFILHAAGLSFSVEEGRDTLKSKIQELEEQVKLKELELSKAKKVHDALLAETEALKASKEAETPAAPKSTVTSDKDKDTEKNKDGEKGKEKAKKGAGAKKKGAAAAAKDVPGPSSTATPYSTSTPVASMSKAADANKVKAKNQPQATEQSSQTSSASSSAAAPTYKDRKSAKKVIPAQTAQIVTTKPEVILLESFITRYGRIGLQDVFRDRHKTAQHAFDGLKTIYELRHLHSSVKETYGTEATLQTVKEKALLLLRSANEGLLQLSSFMKENMPPNPITEANKANLTAAQKRKAASASSKNEISKEEKATAAREEFASSLKDRMKSLACFVLAVLGLICEILDDDEKKWGTGKGVEDLKAELICLVSSEIGEILHILLSFFPLATEYVYRTLLAPLPKQAVDPLAVYNLSGKTTPSTPATSSTPDTSEGNTGRVANVDIRPVLGSLILSLCNLDKMKSYMEIRKPTLTSSTIKLAGIGYSVSSMALWQTRYGLLKAVHGLVVQSKGVSKGVDSTTGNEGTTQKTLVKNKSERLEKVIQETCARETLLGLNSVLDAVSGMESSLLLPSTGRIHNACSAVLNEQQQRDLLKILQELEGHIKRNAMRGGGTDPVMDIVMQTMSKVASSFGSQLLEDVLMRLQ